VAVPVPDALRRLSRRCAGLPADRPSPRSLLRRLLLVSYGTFVCGRGDERALDRAPGPACPSGETYSRAVGRARRRHCLCRRGRSDVVIVTAVMSPQRSANIQSRANRCPFTRGLREGSRLTLRTSHTTINGGRVVVVRSFPDTSCLGRAATGVLGAAPLRCGGTRMDIRFWGTRGSLAKPGRITLRHGGNTSCVEVRGDDGALIVLDCGTGAHGLGQALLSAGPRCDGHLMITHTHWDHIQGFPFFAPLFVPGNTWDIYAPGALGRQLERTLAGQMEYNYFPVTLAQLAATIRFHDIAEGEF